MVGRGNNVVAIEATTFGKLGEAKEIKVKIPVDFHIKLHTLKVLRGQNISTSVEIALERYFREHGGDADGRKYAEITDQAISAFHA